jgi:hypothetical protein
MAPTSRSCGSPTVLKDEAAGLAKLRALLTRQVVAPSVCADPAICHRTVGIEKLAPPDIVLALPRLTAGSVPALF